jgi:glycosyltransferase involved in cell wall biosynthesis
MKGGILYISYDGMLEPLGQSQVLAYLERLAPDWRVHLVSFEKPADWADSARRRTVAERIAAAGIRWHPLTYHKRPTAPATAFDIAHGTARALVLALRHRLSIVHARSYVAGLMALGVKRVTGAKFLFDMRGLWADERVDGGLWPRGGRLYRIAKSIERRLLLAADHVVTLTHASEAEIHGFPYLAERAPPMSVIPTCADLDRFVIQGPPATEPFVLGYVGSVGAWYLLDDMLRCFKHLQAAEPEARLLIINRNERTLIGEHIGQHGIDPAVVEIRAAEHRDLPRLIAGMSAGMALIKPVYSKIASAPTKLAEYLGCGVPCLGNVGVGDMESILECDRVGVALRGSSDDELRRGVERLIALTREPDVQDRCHRTALKLFSLDVGVAAYRAIYERLEASPSGGKQKPLRR